MTATPFFLPTPDEHARTHPDIDEAFALAEASHPDLRARMLVGLVSHEAATATHLRKSFAYLSRDTFTLLAAILNSPAIARSPKTHAMARQYIHVDAIYALLRQLDDPSRYLRDFLRIADDPSVFPDVAAQIRAAFPAEQIAAELDDMVAEWCGRVAVASAENPLDDYLPGLSFLSETHVARIVETLLAHAPTMDTYACASALNRVFSRKDLSETTADIAFDCLVALMQRDVAERSGLDREGLLRSYLLRQYLRMFANPDLPQSVFVRALLVPEIVEILAEETSLNLPFPPAAILEAVRAGAPLSVLSRFYLYNLPEDILTLALDRIAESDPGAHEDDLLVLIRGSIDAIGTPAWARLYALWCAQASTKVVDDGLVGVEGDVVDRFAATVRNRAIGWADPSAVPVLARFAAWASASPDPRLRRHAVAECYLPEQVRSAVDDPSGLVRAEVLAHPLATLEIVDQMTADPDPLVRLAVAKHSLAHEETLRRLAHDPDEEVRAVIADLFMEALA